LRGFAQIRPEASRLFTTEIPLWEIAARTAIVYGAVLGGLRLAGKRELGQMSPFDLVVVLLVANAVQNAMVGPDSSVTGGLLAAGLLVALDYLLSVLRGHIPWLRKTIEGQPTLLIHDGVYIEENMKREHIDREEVLMALREHGIDDPSNVRLAILETDGSVSVVPGASEAPLRSSRHVRSRPRQ
jgi:uncharacterized membrane protein YcaP (DUF421 family)